MPINIERLREEKTYRKRRANKKHQNSVFTKLKNFSYKSDVSLLKTIIEYIHLRLNDIGFKNLSFTDSDISIDNDFTFSNHFESSFKTIEKFVGALSNNIGGVIELNFATCKSIETAPVFIMQVIRFELDEIIKLKSQKLLYINVKTEFKVIPSKSKNVNRLLLLTGLLTLSEYNECLHSSNEDNSDIFEPIYRTGYYKGSKSQKHYLENKKNTITTIIVNYINNCLASHDSSLNKLDQNSLEGILSEVLNNAEDHGVFNYWYVTANFSKETTTSTSNEEIVGEMNLSIMNFGESIYEGLYGNKEINFQNFSELLIAKQNLELKFSNHGFSDDNLFTLYALQDGTSRLKYQDDSRGTGTIKFLNSFLKLGDFEDKAKNYIPRMSIFSGNTQLICDNNYKPFDNNGVYLLTLNPENSLRFPPKRTNLKELKSKFPGTLLNVTLYLNKAHLSTKISHTDHAART